MKTKSTRRQDWKIVEKKNPLATHAVFMSRESAERFLAVNVPDYCARGLYMDKSLTPDSFQVVPANGK